MSITGFIYLLKIHSIPDVYKIGVATNIKNRISTLKSSTFCETEEHSGVSLIASFESNDVYSDEKKLHLLFRKFHHSEPKNAFWSDEYFKFDSSALSDVVKEFSRHNSSRIILRQKTRILPPLELVMLIAELNTYYKLVVNALVHSGLRIVEFWWVVDNPSAYHSSSRVIDLPKDGSAKKKKCTYKERTIRLTEEGCKAFDALFAAGIEFKKRDAMRGALRRAADRAGLGTKGIHPDMFRKILASYLVEVRKELGIDTLEICANMGHDEKTLRVHYYGIGFTPKEHMEILNFLKGWK